MSARREVGIGLASYAAYLAVRRMVWTDEGRRRAAENGQKVVALERRLGIAIEPRVQAVALRHRRTVDVLNGAYAAANVALSVGWLIALHRAGSPIFARERRAAVTAMVAALPFFAAFPTAPPRTRRDFTDTMATRGLDLDHPLLVRFYNPVAAMPSHHLAFAVVTAGGKAAVQTHPALRWAWRVYPFGVAATVIATANHYVLDVVAGAALGVVSRVLTR